MELQASKLIHYKGGYRNLFRFRIILSGGKARALAAFSVADTR
ncbi:hypothetical protein ABDI16_21750 [Cytobacillus firmus]